MSFFQGYLAQGTGPAHAFIENANSGYARVRATFNNLAGGTASLASAVKFTNTTSVTVTQRALYDAPTGGNLICWWNLATSVAASTGSPDSIAAGALNHTYPQLFSNGAGVGAVPVEFAANAQIATTDTGLPVWSGVGLEVVYGVLSVSSKTGASLKGPDVVTYVSDANYTIKATDFRIAYKTLTAARNVTLPSAASVAGQRFIIKDEAGTAATNNISLVGTIDGSTTQKISTNYGVYRFYSSGTAFYSE